MDAAPPPRILPRVLSLGFALLLALIEFGGVVGTWHPSQAALLDAFCSAALVYALFASVFISSGLVPARGVARLIAMTAFRAVVIAAGAVLFSSWVVRWLIGAPLNPRAARLLMENPLSALLHLNDENRIMLGALAGVTFVFLYVCVRMLNYAARAWSGGYLAPRALIAFASVLVVGLSTWGVASASLSWSSYAAVLARGNGSNVPTNYTCPRSPPVAVTPLPTGTPKSMPVIVVILESLRADVLSKHPDAMPFLSQLPRETLVFDKAYAPATHSDFADIAIWYSRYALYSRLPGYPVNAPWRGKSAFEYFKASGYDTGYISSQNELWGDMINWMKLPAIDTFFDAHNLIDPERLSAAQSEEYIAQLSHELTQQGKVPDSRTLELAAQWASRHSGRPFFLGINLQNTHLPYIVPDGAPEPFQPAESGMTDVMYAWPASRAPFQLNRYLNAAYNMDAVVARFAQQLRDAGLWDRSAILFVGDHGEAFREHGWISHGGPAYDETSRVLALLKLPKGDPRNGTTIDRVVSSIDFVPMLADLSGLPQWAGFQGHSPLREGASTARFITVNAQTRGNAVVQWPWKLMRSSFPEQVVELYNLESDPKETRNLVRDEPAVASRLAAQLAEYRTCQLSFYGDRAAYTRLQPPQY